MHRAASAILLPILMLPAACNRPPRLRVEVHTDLAVPAEVDGLVSRVYFASGTTEEAVALDQVPPFIFSVVSSSSVPSVDLEIELVRGDELVARLREELPFPESGEACVAAHLLRDGRAEITACGGLPAGADAGQPDGGEDDAGVSMDGGSTDGGDGDGGTKDAGMAVFDFPVKNIDPDGLDYQARFSIESGETCFFSSEDLAFTGECPAALPASAVVPQPNGPSLVVLSMRELEVAGRFSLTGDRGVVLAVSESATISGSVDASAYGVLHGAGGGACILGKGDPGADCVGGGGGGGGGGSEAGMGGGSGNSGACAGGAGGEGHQLTGLEPLVGGCAGGDGRGAGGGGGGALQIVATRLFLSGSLAAAGGGGRGGRPVGATSGGGGGGGGSGGVILVQAGTLDMDEAHLEARGGGGGGGVGPNTPPGEAQDGDDGIAGGDGGSGDGAGSAQGGDGGEGGTDDPPGPGMPGQGLSGGGGGGGAAGTIRIEAVSCTATDVRDAPSFLGGC